MLKLKLPMLATVVALSISPDTSIATEDGNELLKGCNVFVQLLDEGTMDQESAIDVGRCIGFMEATLNWGKLYEIKNPESAFFCTPSDLKTGQAVRIIVKYMREHPEDLHEPKIFLVIAALRSAYPCSGR